ncbi:Ig domain-containing protein, partial [Brucella intermedia]|uniref:Ig domain-containing protein n=1 Tax=Brucella intermedia TaxID=94625 RepID=UPI002362E6B0
MRKKTFTKQYNDRIFSKDSARDYFLRYLISILAQLLLAIVLFNGSANAGDISRHLSLTVGVRVDQKINLPRNSDPWQSTVWYCDKGDEIPGIRYGTDSVKTLTISGMPERDGTYKFTCRQTGLIFNDYIYYTVNVAPPIIQLNPDYLPSGKINLPYAEVSLSASGGIAPYSYQAQGLPKGLNLSGDRIAGTPSEAGSFSVTVTATDKDGYKADKTYTLA